MRKIHVGRDCACGCSRKTEVGEYASWHINNGIPELQKPCACGCGKLTTGAVNCHTREPHRFFHGHGGTVARRKGYKKLCACGCGRKAVDGGLYSVYHQYHPLEELINECGCGCGGLTSGKVMADGMPSQYIWHHASFNEEDSRGKCLCGCGKLAGKSGYAYYHVVVSIESLKQPCRCGCGEMTSGRISSATGLPIVYVQRHAAKPFKGKQHLGYRTNIEQMVEDVLIALNIRYIFDGQLGHYFPDFQCPDYRVILEADGDFWHSLLKRKKNEASREAYFAKQGWIVKHLSEKDIKRDAYAIVTQALGIPNL